MIRALSSWLSHPVVDWSLGIFSLVALLASIVLVPRFLASLPPDYLRSARQAESPPLLLRVVRNLFGAVLVVLGAAMLLLPGQGLLTLLVGLLLLDFPGKMRLIRKILSRPKVLAVVNRLRAHRNASPLSLA